MHQIFNFLRINGYILHQIHAASLCNKDIIFQPDTCLFSRDIDPRLTCQHHTRL